MRLGANLKFCICCPYLGPEGSKSTAMMKYLNYSLQKLINDSQASIETHTFNLQYKAWISFTYI